MIQFILWARPMVDKTFEERLVYFVMIISNSFKPGE